MAHGAKVQEAVRALKRFTNAGVSGIDSSKQEHVNAYLTLRATVGRVDGNRLKSYLENKTTDVHHGARSKLEFWAVPKINFTEPLPEDIRNALVDPDDLSEAEIMGGGTVDHDEYWIVDHYVPRHLLKKNVRTLTFFSGSLTKLGTKAQSWGAGSSGQPVLDDVQAKPATGGGRHSPVTGRHFPNTGGGSG